jgi:hypothetical protein
MIAIIDPGDKKDAVWSDALNRLGIANVTFRANRPVNAPEERGKRNNKAAVCA